MGTDDNDTRVTQQVAILADSYSTPRKWSRRERPTDVTRRAVVTSSRSAALTAHDAFPRTRQSRDSRSGTWSSRPPSVTSLTPPSSLSTLSPRVPEAAVLRFMRHPRQDRPCPFPRGPSQPCTTTEGAVQQGWQEDQPATTGCRGCGWCWSINAHGQRRYVADDGWRACFDSMNGPGYDDERRKNLTPVASWARILIHTPCGKHQVACETVQKSKTLS